MIKYVLAIAKTLPENWVLVPEYWVPLSNSSLEAPEQVQLCQSVE